MGCNCIWTEFVLGVVILVFTVWPTLIFTAMTSMWIVVVAAVLLVLHSLSCKGGMCAPKTKMALPKTISKKSSKKKRR
jgi:hypothetical protein